MTNSPEMQNREIIWILGGGKFGRRAAEQMTRRFPEAAITVIDRQNLSGFGAAVETITADGVVWLVENFRPESDVTRIIPALPVHLAAEWLYKKAESEGRTVRQVPLPDSLISRLPNPFPIAPGRVAVSHADFLCPPDCPEPDDFCTMTGEKRPLPLYQLLETAGGHLLPLILRSRQFAPGVGGFFPGDLWALLERFWAGAGRRLLVATACKCHGIIDTMYLEETSG